MPWCMLAAYKAQARSKLLFPNSSKFYVLLRFPMKVGRLIKPQGGFKDSQVAPRDQMSS